MTREARHLGKVQHALQAMTRRWLSPALFLLAGLLGVPPAWAADDGVPADLSRYADRPMLPDPGAADCPDVPHGLEQVRGNLCRHTSGGQVFQQAGATVVANQRAIEPVVGERLPTALPDRVFDERITITLGIQPPAWPVAMRGLDCSERA